MCIHTLSFSVSAFVKQWPFMTGLDGSLSDRTITSSGEDGCCSVLMSLMRKKTYQKVINEWQFLNSSSRWWYRIILQQLSCGTTVFWDREEDRNQEINKGEMVAGEEHNNCYIFTGRFHQQNCCSLCSRNKPNSNHVNHRASFNQLLGFSKQMWKLNKPVRDTPAEMGGKLAYELTRSDF